MPEYENGIDLSVEIDPRVKDCRNDASLLRLAVTLAVEEGRMSTSVLQRRLGVGFGKACELLILMEQLGAIVPGERFRPSRVVWGAEELACFLARQE